MENLSRIAQGIFLGNGEVWNFLDYAVNRNCGGLLYKTQANGFLGTNLINNFNGGFTRRYEYSNISNEGGYAIDRIWGGYRNSPKGYGGNIGDLYMVSNVPNSEINFISKDEFYDLEESIRNRNLSVNTETKYKNKGVESYTSEVDESLNNTHIEKVDVGSFVNFNTGLNYITTQYTLENFGEKARTKNLLTEISIEKGKGLEEEREKYRSITIDSQHPIIYNDITSKVANRTFKTLESMDVAAQKVRDRIKHYQTSSQRFIGLASKNVVLKDKATFEGLFNEYTTKGTEIAKIPSLENYGLYSYYSKEREKYVSTNISDFPGVYGIVSPNEQIRFYNINKENDFQGEVSISPDFKGGRHSVYNVSEGTRSYSFYQEAEKGVIPVEIETNVMDGSIVSLTDYNGGSSILRKTNELFKTAKIKSLINRFHTDSKDVDSELITSYSKYGISRGRNLFKSGGADMSSGYENPYCRVWTAHHQYSKLKDRIRPFVDESGEPESIEKTQTNYGELRPNDGAYRLSEHSVLRKDGFVRITPTHIDGQIFNEPIKNYMFSIENLAWRDITVDEQNTALSKEQRGPNGGRIMWFPPYNLKFSENVNVNWNTNTFIGRGEEIYTYTNTVRSGTLDFTMLIDHPSILNKWRGTDNISGEEKEKRDQDILRFFAGCGNLNDEVTPSKPKKEEKEKSPENTPNIEAKPVFQTKKIGYVVFFPNNFSGQDYISSNNIDSAITVLEKYNSGGKSDCSDKSYENQILQEHNKESNGFVPSGSAELIKKQIFGGDDDVEIHYLDDLLKIESNFTGDKIFEYSAENCKILNVETKGFASNHGYEKSNLELCNRRRTMIEKILEHSSSHFDKNSVTYNSQVGSIIEVPNVDGREDINGEYAKIARAAYVIVNIQWKEENVTHEGALIGGATTVYGFNVDNVNKVEEVQDVKTSNIKTETTVIETEYTYDNEYLYFSEIRDDSMVHKHIVDKVRYFDPAFHSITPEGFNARLTFLHQCTRQGPTNAVSSGNINSGSEDFLKFAGNLAFGRAPFCILRIGDFFNTKICIDSMSITYDNNGVQWDLNPEGVGVQPMYANISLSFKFLGGQDIVKPIERLQNAVTANYYANASIYSRHADNNKNYYDALEDNPKYRIKKTDN